MTEKSPLSDAAKAAVKNLGMMPELGANVPVPQNADVLALQAKAQDMVEGLEQVIGSGKLDVADLQKLDAVLTRLRSALQAGPVSHEALAAALSEASIAIGMADGISKNVGLHQRTEQLWQKIEQQNRDIDDDFEKMRKAGIVFDEKLWNKHTQLVENLQSQPHDIELQRELIAVDAKLLQQVEPQLKKCPAAKPHFDDAKKKSEERYNDVETVAALTKVAERNVEFAGMDWGDNQGRQVTMNDVGTPTMSKQVLQPNAALPPRN